MTDLLRLLGEWVAFLWPLKKVRQWQRGLRYFCGKYRKDIGPGIYIAIPWFHDIYVESMLRGIIQTPRLDITATDGTMITLQASATVQVKDLKRAYQEVDAYMETTQEHLSVIVATKLAEVDAARLAPEKRARLLTDLRKWVQAETEQYGVEVSQLGFTTFVVNARSFRLLGDIATAVPWETP
jgi:regulator of protease activity HflC (stomatin/prohibitin superfamily)